MNHFIEHLVKTMLAGVAALLPAAATIYSVIYLERVIGQSGLANHPFYFPGLGLASVVIGLYLVGLLITTLVGRWLVGTVDALLSRIPAFGHIYRSAKGLLGIEDAESAHFHGVVFLEDPTRKTAEIAFLTRTLGLATPDSSVVFVPSSPNPLVGRLVVAKNSLLSPMNIPVRQAMQILLTAGASVGIDPGHQSKTIIKPGESVI